MALNSSLSCKTWMAPKYFPILNLQNFNPHLTEIEIPIIQQWFYELLIAEFVDDFKKIEIFSCITNYDWHRITIYHKLDQVINLFYGHSLILMAFNTFIEPHLKYLNLQRQIPRSLALELEQILGSQIGNKRLMHLFFTKKVEVKAINESSYGRVLYAMYIFQNHSIYQPNVLLEKDLLSYLLRHHPRKQNLLYHHLKDFAYRVHQMDIAKREVLTDSHKEDLTSVTHERLEAEMRNVDPLQILCEAVNSLFKHRYDDNLMDFKHILPYIHPFTRLVLRKFNPSK